MSSLKKLTVLSLSLLFVFSACVQNNDVDFTQADQINLNQQIKGSMISFTTTIADFGDVNNLPFDGFDFNTPIDAFNNTTVQNELIKLILNFDFENTFKRDFNFNINFLDANNVVVFSRPITVNKNGTTLQQFVIEGLEVEQIKRATQIAINVTVINSVPANTVDNTVGAFVRFKLGAIFDFNNSQPATASLIDITASLPDLTHFDGGNLPFTHFNFETPLDIFNNTTIQNNLVKTEFHFEIENTFNRDFELVFQFLDGNNQVTYTIPIVINKTTKTIKDVLIEGTDLVNLKKSKKVNITTDVINATTIDNTPGAFINFKSSATFSF